MRKLLLIICVALMMIGCGSEVQTVPPLPGTLPKALTAQKVDTDIYFDATVSMRGFTTLAAGNVYLTLPDLLGDLCGSLGEVKFYSFGEQIHALDGRAYRQFTTPEVYTEPITAVANAFSRVIRIGATSPRRFARNFLLIT